MINRVNLRHQQKPSVGVVFASGFTMLELVIVMVIIAILAAILIPTAIDMSGTSNQRATNSVAGALTAASASNALQAKAGAAGAITVTNCQHVSSALPTSFPLPAGYTITSQTIASGALANCTVNSPSTGISAIFIGKGT